MELSTEIQNLLFDMVKDKLPLWKQMRALEVVSAIIAEIIIEMGVIVLCDPPEIHWADGIVTKPPAAKRGKKGKKTQKSQHGIFGELVASLAPALPAVQSKPKATSSKSKKFKAPIKVAVEVEQQDEDMQVDEDGNSVVVHQGLPVQQRRGRFHSVLLFVTVVGFH